MPNKKSNRKKGLIVIAAVVLIALTAVGIRAAVKAVSIRNYVSQMDGYVDSITLVSDPQNVELVSVYLGQTLEESQIDYDAPDLSFTDEENAMRFDLNTYDVYQVHVVFNNDSDQEAGIMAADYCEAGRYLLVPPQIYSDVWMHSSAEVDFYYFVSKSFGKSDVEAYLAANGLHLKIQIISDNGIDEFGYGEKTVFLNDAGNHASAE